MSGAGTPRRGRLARLDDAVLGAPGTRRGWYGDLALGLHPWLRPFYALVVLVGVGLMTAGVVQRHWGLVVFGLAWAAFGLLYLHTVRGKAVRPPPRQTR